MESWQLDLLRALEGAHLVARIFEWAGEMPRMVRGSNFGARILEAKEDREIGEAATEWANFVFHAGLENEAAVEPAVVDALIEFVGDGKRARGDVMRRVFLLLVVFLGKGPCCPPKLRSEEFVAVMVQAIKGETVYPALVILAMIALSGSEAGMIVRSHVKAKDLEQRLALTQDQAMREVLLELVFWCCCAGPDDAEWMASVAAILESYAKTIGNCPPVMLAGFCALRPGILDPVLVEDLPWKFQPNMTVREFVLLSLMEGKGRDKEEGKKGYRFLWVKEHGRSNNATRMIINIAADNNDGRVRYLALRVIKENNWKLPTDVKGVLLARMGSQDVDRREAILIAKLLLSQDREEIDVRIAQEILSLGDAALTEEALLSFHISPSSKQLFEEYNGPAILNELAQSDGKLRWVAERKLRSWQKCVDKESETKDWPEE